MVVLPPAREVKRQKKGEGSPFSPPTPRVQPEARRRRDELAYDRPCHGPHGSPMTGPVIDRDGTRSLPLAGSNNAAARAVVLEVSPTPWVQPEARRESYAMLKHARRIGGRVSVVSGL